MKQIVVLPDGKTWAPIDGCKVVDVPADWSEGKIAMGLRWGKLGQVELEGTQVQATV